MSKSVSSLQPFLEKVYRKHHHPRTLGSDPLVLVKSHDNPADQEMAAYFMAMLAYGRVEQVLVSGRKVLSALGQHPAETLRNATPRQLKSRLRGVYHRFNTANDLALLAWVLGQVLREYDSLGAHFQQVAWNGRDDGETDTIPALTRWTQALRALDASPFYKRGLPDRCSFNYLLPFPEKGSACKRLHMFLRWMARPADGIDLGLWDFLPTSHLLMPIDTHIARLATNLGLNTRRQINLATTRDITAQFRRIAPDDPVRYDYSLCRLGILQECPTREDLTACRTCGLSPVCQTRARLERLAA
jgi:uncharacterized protein (TIGR02757 family)